MKGIPPSYGSKVQRSLEWDSNFATFSFLFFSNIIKWSTFFIDFSGHHFKRESARSISSDLPYDINSIMHGSSKMFSKNGRKTLILKKKYRPGKLGSSTMSQLDIQKLNRLYR